VVIVLTVFIKLIIFILSIIFKVIRVILKQATKSAFAAVDIA